MDSQTQTHAQTISVPADSITFELAYEQHEDEIAAVPESELEPINLDVPAMVTTIMGAYHNIIALRPQMVQLPDFRIADVDNLQSYAGATGFVHARYMRAIEPPPSLSPLAAQVAKGRNVLVQSLTLLVSRDLAAAEVLDGLHGGLGHRAIAFETVAAADALRALPADVFARCALTAEEIDAATKLAADLIDQLGRREQGPEAVAKVARLRQQGYTLSLHKYEQARRAVAYLRFAQGDADSIAPSLYAGRTGRARRDEAAVPVTPAGGTTPVTPITPAPMPAGPNNGGPPFTE